MTTRCKVLCITVLKRHAGGWYVSQGVEFLYEAEFIAVTGASEENKKFFASTPTLNLKVSAINGDLFQPGKEYYLDFLPAAPPIPVA
jgi:hypothetical protein